jgi:cell division protein ZipA
MNDVNLLRVIIGIACVALIVAIWFLGKPRKPGQGRRVEGRRSDPARAEPTLRDDIERDALGQADFDIDKAEQAELDLLERNLSAHGDTPSPPPNLGPALRAGTPRGNTPVNQPSAGIRRETHFDRIVTLYVAARPGLQLSGPDLIVAAEKAGLVHGHMNIFHRMVDGHPEQGPVFSIANMIKPGSFDLTRLHELHTPGISFFMTLPAPMPALDAWDAMLPTAQRMAELLDALVLDEERNALGRQRIAHIRDELRAYDRQREQQQIRTPLR